MDPSSAAGIQRRLDDLLDHLPAGVVVHGPDGRIRSANRLACELLGQDAQALVGRDAASPDWGFVRSDLLPMRPEDYPANVVLRTCAKLRQVILGVPAQGREPLRWLICNAYPECDPDGTVIQVVVCFTDCTALKRAKHRLQKSEQRLRLALRGSTDAPWDIDLVSGEVFYSRRWWRMLGYRPGELPAGGALWLELAHPDDRPALEAFMRDLSGAKVTRYSVELQLRHRDGHYVPVLSRGYVLRNRQGRPLRISGTNTDLTERKLAEHRLYRAAYFDHLTGLPNRRLLVEELDKAMARAARSGQFGALLLLDLDNFKLLNETLGHELGDQLLGQVSERLRRALRHSDGLARLGGDEFAIMLEQMGTTTCEAATEAGHLVAKLSEALAPPYHLSGRLIVSTPSIGVVLFDGATAGIDTLLRQAELAMYGAKADGRNTARFFDPAMQAAADHQLALEGALRSALALKQFVLYCQPQFSVMGRLVGAEVLVRWRRDDGELLGPGEFIGLAESTGLIGPLGRHVLEESCRTLARWRGDRALARLKLAVNVSVHQMRSPDFPEDVARILTETGAPPSRLCLELTESVFAENVTEIIERMHALRERGIEFSLDDFGTGYSSLAYLRRFPLAALKIDRSFVHDVHIDPDAAPIVEAIIALARTLKLDIVAEGVEHEEQRSFLADGGCGALQGYLLGRPMPMEEFETRYGSPSAVPS